MSGVIQTAGQTPLSSRFIGRTGIIDHQIIYPVMYTLVGGGGGGGFGGDVSTGAAGGGGGSGGMIQGIFYVTTGQTYTITLGGAGSGKSSDSDSYAGVGGDSDIAGTFADIASSELIAYGGGRGTNHCTTADHANAYGSQKKATGGGGAPTGTNAYNVAYSFIGAPGSSQGGGGGCGGSYNDNNFAGGGGGGGAGSAGGAPTMGNGPVGAIAPGGDGLKSICNGTTYGGGGGGGYSNYRSSTENNGGTGGGGAGGNNGNNAAAGTANTGGGGGGGGGASTASNRNGANGGTGVCVLRMATSFYTGSTSGSPTVSNSGLDTILLYTSSGTYVA